MAITLDHHIVPSNDKDEGAKFFARMFDLPYEGAGHFAPVRVDGGLTLDFADDDDVPGLHYAFVVSEDEFDGIFGRVTAEGVTYGSGPFSWDDGQINRRRGGRGFYFKGGPDPHLWEVMTVAETGT